jgi:hypothetical protein
MEIWRKCSHAARETTAGESLSEMHSVRLRRRSCLAQSPVDNLERRSFHLCAEDERENGLSTEWARREVEASYLKLPVE